MDKTTSNRFEKHIESIDKSLKSIAESLNAIRQINLAGQRLAVEKARVDIDTKRYEFGMDEITKSHLAGVYDEFTG